MPKNIEISPYGSLLVFKKGYTPEFVLKTIDELNLKGLRIFAHLKEDRLANIDFLKDYTFLEALDITSVDDYDFSFLPAISQLKDLSISSEGKNRIDLSSQVNLEFLSLKWRKGIQGIEHCKRLKELILWEYDEFDLSPFQMLHNLEKLAIKTSSIKVLKGLEHLASLAQLQLGNCRALRSIKALDGLKKLTSIEIEACSKIEDYNSLTDLRSLEMLGIIDCKAVSSIKFIQNFPSLKTLSLLGNTDILDGDLIPAKNIPHVNYRPRKHYNIKIENPEGDAITRRNLEMLKKLRK